MFILISVCILFGLGCIVFGMFRGALLYEINKHQDDCASQHLTAAHKAIKVMQAKREASYGNNKTN